MKLILQSNLRYIFRKITKSLLGKVIPYSLRHNGITWESNPNTAFTETDIWLSVS